MTRDDVEIIEKSVAYDGYFRIDRYRLRHRLFAGEMGPEITREVFERGHAVGVLPYDPVRRQVVVIEQFRIGAFAAGEEPWLMECVAGIIEPGESAEQVARRELIEETGLKAQALLPMQRYMVSPGGASETVQLYLARVDSSAAGGIHGLDHEVEDIRVTPYAYEGAMALLADGKIDNAMTVVSLQWLALNIAKVEDAWGAGPS